MAKRSAIGNTTRKTASVKNACTLCEYPTVVVTPEIFVTRCCGVNVTKVTVVPAQGAEPTSFALAPTLEIAWKSPKRNLLPQSLTVSREGEAKVTFDFKIPRDKRCLGLGERYGGQNLRHRVHTLFTTDDHHHIEATDALYKSIPLLYLFDSRDTVALFLDCPAPQRWDLDSELTGRGRIEVFTRRGISLYVIGPCSLSSAVRVYTELTGRTQLPPRWSLGHQQSRWSYPTEAEVRRIAAEFRARHIPCDTLVLDIDYMKDYRAFTISRKRFPRFESMISDLAKQGFRIVPILDPGIAKTERDATFTAGVKRDIFCRTSLGSHFVGKVWPGDCCFPDFVREDVRSFWSERLQILLAKGVAGIWNDMNEPALFGQQRPFDPGKSELPPDGEQLFLQETPEGKVGHFEVRGLYGMQMARASFEAQQAARPDERPFTLTRSTFAGGQRYGAVWLGDNKSWFEHLRMSIPMLLNMGLSGFPFAGVDIGGFSENADSELVLRWYQTGIFYPFFRNHCATGQRAQEPWTFGPQVERCIGKLIRARYSLTRYIEQLFVEHRETGAPLMRPLAWHYPNDTHAAALDDEFLFGSAMLVAPIVKRATSERVVYFPKGTWEPFDGGNAIVGPCHRVVRWNYEQIPAFVRHGSVIPMVAPCEHMAHLERKRIILRCYGGQGNGRLWLDDGHSMAYERGVFDDWRIAFAKGKVTLTAEHLGYPKRPKRVCVELAGRQILVDLT